MSRFGSFRQQLEKAAEKARETVTTLANNLEQTVRTAPDRPAASGDHPGRVDARARPCVRALSHRALLGCAGQRQRS
jgi:hypothetical protein